MDDSINVDDVNLRKEKKSLSDKQDDIDKIAFTASTENNTSEWSIIHFDTDIEEDVDGFNDLIPSSWITKRGTLCWYPMNDHQSTIQKLVKQCAKPNLEWDLFSMKKIEENIDNYDRGMKMLVKIIKNPKAKLYSDIEEKGKGKRQKKPIKRFDDSEKENIKKRRHHVQSTTNLAKLQPIPKFIDISNSRANQPLSDEKKNPKSSSIDEVHLLDINGNGNIKLQQSTKIPYESTVSSSGCKIESKTHKCSYTPEGKVTLESLADAICQFNADMLSYKFILRKTDKNVESFLETQATMEKPNPKIENFNTIQVLDEFPLKDVDDLKKTEHKLKKDDTFHSKVVDALHLGTVGESLQKKVNHMLRMVLNDNLASLFNWKGQRGNKLKLSKRRISKIMIEAIAKEIPTINDTIFGRKAGPWLAQASFRIKKHQDVKNNDTDEISSSNEDDETDSSKDGNKLRQKNET